MYSTFVPTNCFSARISLLLVKINMSRISLYAFSIASPSINRGSNSLATFSTVTSDALPNMALNSPIIFDCI